MNTIALSILLSVLSGTTASVKSVVPPELSVESKLHAKNANDIGQFEIHEGKQNQTWLTNRFRESLWQLDVRLREYKGQNPISLDDYLASPDYTAAKRMAYLNSIWKTTHTTHTWVFDKPDTPDGMIVRALELEDLSGPSGYHIRAILHCYDEPYLCKSFRDRQTPLLAPKPVATAGDLALLQWHNRVLSEPCTVFARNMRQPPYPTTALRNGIEGSVIVGIFFNSCGNVRDAWVQQSSRNRELDRAAVINALKWQIDMQSLPKTEIDPRRADVPVRFMLSEESASGVSSTPIK